MRNTILPPHKRDQGQSTKSDIHRLAEQLSQLKVIGRGRAYRVDERVELGIHRREIGGEAGHGDLFSRVYHRPSVSRGAMVRPARMARPGVIAQASNAASEGALLVSSPLHPRG